MKKWQELLFNALFNYAVALMVGGILKLFLDFTNILGSVVIFFGGLYLFFAVAIISKNVDERK